MKVPKFTGSQHRDYFKEHVRHSSKKNFYEVKKPMYVFKKTHSAYGHTITNLIIPVGAKVYWYGDSNDILDRKMRASIANVHSSFARKERRKVDVAYGRASFEYKANTTVRPTEAFSMCDSQCESGIHFFLNLKDALDYY